MLQKHVLNTHYSKSILVLYTPGALHIQNMLLLEHCASKYAPGTYMTLNVTPNSPCSQEDVHMLLKHLFLEYIRAKMMDECLKAMVPVS